MNRHETEPTSGAGAGQAKLTVISLGAGVQSTTMALMAAKGEIEPMPNCAIFADTGWEPKRVYAHLDWLENQLPFPVHRVSDGNIKDHIKARTNLSGGRFASVPFFTEGGGMGRRQCTREFKITPLQRKQRELLGYQKGERIPQNSIEVWIGISTDEIVRMKDAENKWQVNRWPLIERRMNRNDCLKWIERNGYPKPPKSACVCCPYHSDSEWRYLRENDPDEWAEAVRVDKGLRENGPARGMEQREYMHRSLRPLDEIDLSTPEDHGQINMFNDECDGMCGV